MSARPPAFEELRSRFVGGFPARIDALRGLEPGLLRGEAAALERARALAHQIAGAGGSYGWPELSAAARRLELAEEGDHAAGLGALIDALERVQQEHQLGRLDRPISGPWERAGEVPGS